MRVSIVVPVLNEEEFLEDCLRGLRGQTVPCEIIVVDGGSVDRTVEIAWRLADRVIVSGQGIAASRDAGTREASGEVIVSTDADTAHPANWLYTLTRHFEDPSVVVTGGPARPLNPSPTTNLYTSGLNAIASSLHLFAGYNMAFRKSAWRRVGGYLGLRKGEDWELSGKLARVGRSVYDPQAVCLIDVPMNRQLELVGIIASAGMVPTGLAIQENVLAGLGLGFFGAEVATAILVEPTPIHHSQLAGVGLVLLMAAKDYVPVDWNRMIGGILSGVWFHHIVTEDVLKPEAFGVGAPLWLGMTMVFLAVT